MHDTDLIKTVVFFIDSTKLAALFDVMKRFITSNDESFHHIRKDVMNKTQKTDNTMKPLKMLCLSVYRGLRL